MKRFIISLAVFTLGLSACKDQLDIINPNQPTLSNLSTEQGIIALAQGALYVNGFQQTPYFGSFFGVVLGYHERMGDLVNTSAANYYNNQVSCPDKVILDDGSLLLNPNQPGTQRDFLKAINVSSSAANPMYYEWTLMYSMNMAMNKVLLGLESIEISVTKLNTLKAWVYFWKGFAYSRVGSMYTAGIINEEVNTTNNVYYQHDQILIHAEENFAMAEEMLKTIGDEGEYFEIMNKLIPEICQVGKGLAPSTVEWRRHINTLRARNILVNRKVTSMTNKEWDSIVQLTENGIQQEDHTFTVRTDELRNLLRPQGFLGYVAGQTIGSPSDGGGINQISERLIQEFESGDKRFQNNFVSIPTFIGQKDRGTGFNTRYLLVDGGNGIPGVVVMCNLGVGAQEIYIAGTYEENTLMRAEAHIYRGNIDTGLGLIDEIRVYQGAGLPATSGTGLTRDQAIALLRKERRISLAFYGLSFYDARRWGVLQDGRKGCVVVDFDGGISTNATIEYNYKAYWDVPIAELLYNPPSADSAPVQTPD